MVEDRRDAAQKLALDHALEVREEVLDGAATSAAAVSYGRSTASIGPWSARMTAMSKSSYGWRSSSRGVAASATAARASVPFSISRFMLILKSFSVGSWRIDSAPVIS